MSLFNKDKFLLYWKLYSKNKLLRYGSPLLLLVLGGSVFLKQFTSLRYEYSKMTRNIKPEEIADIIQLKKPEEVTLESEYDKMKEVDLDSWTNKRGPRPWEDSQDNQTKKISDDTDGGPSKKRKIVSYADLDLFAHSSLTYTSFKTPPLVEYNTVESYCEKNLGKSLLPSHNVASHSGSDLSKVRSISSPIVLKTPTRPGSSRKLNDRNLVPPYAYFSIEELSLVKCLSHWANTKVCPVGRIEYEPASQECQLHSVLEKGSWQVSLDTSLLSVLPQPKTVLQIFGCLEVVSGKPFVKVNFSRNIGSADLNLFVSSYRMMQKYVPDFLSLPKTVPNQSKNEEVVDIGVGCELNDTLDGYNLSIVDNCGDTEVKKLKNNML